MLPTFNYGFCSGEPFDILHTRSEMGALTEAARKHPLAHRTGHPIYSFAFIGHRQFILNNYSGYGQDSPFGILHKNRGKIAVLDLDDKGAMTYYHYVEEALNVPYRYHKVFTGKYTDSSGMTQDRSYGLFVRDLKQGVVTEVNPMGGLLWTENIWQGYHPYEGPGLRVGGAAQIFDATAQVILDGKAEGMLYQVKNPVEYIRSMASVDEVIAHMPMAIMAWAYLLSAEPYSVRPDRPNTHDRYPPGFPLLP